MRPFETGSALALTVGEDAIDLEGTHRVAVYAELGEEANRLSSALNGPVIVRYRDRCCGAIVDRVEWGPGQVMMDRFVRSHLQAVAGDEVNLVVGELPKASEIEVTAPQGSESESFRNLIAMFLVGKPVTKDQVIPVFNSPLTGEEQIGKVVRTAPTGIVLVGRDTSVAITPGRVEKPGSGYTSIGGLGREIERIREIVELPFRHPDLFQSLGMAPPRGLILYGPPGTGKTLICRALAHEVGATVLNIRGPEIISGWYGGSEQNLRRIFDQAKAKAPAIIVIDELDSIAPRRDKSQGEVEHRIVATLLTLMDGLVELKGVIVVGTTNSINNIDPALRRAGRFEDEIHIGPPDEHGRQEILDIHTRRMPLASDVDLQILADQCHGFVGADLASLCRRAAYCALRRHFGALEDALDKMSNLRGLLVSAQDFESALTKIKPSGLRGVMVETPREAGWHKIGGLSSVKQTLIENVIIGIKKRSVFRKAGIRPAQGLLLYGPPGTGKTMLARTLAAESGANLIAIRGPEIHSKWFGESEDKLRLIFRKAREAAPCIILFDEIDAIGATRGAGPSSHLTDSIVNQLLAELDGIDVNEGVFSVGTTNRIELVDPALLRPGRFDCQVEVPLPDQEARESIFRVHLFDKNLEEGVKVEGLAAGTDGFSGADIAEVCRLATMNVLREHDFEVEAIQLTGESLERALEEVKRTQQHLREFGF